MDRDKKVLTDSYVAIPPNIEGKICRFKFRSDDPLEYPDLEFEAVFNCLEKSDNRIWYTIRNTKTYIAWSKLKEIQCLE